MADLGKISAQITLYLGDARALASNYSSGHLKWIYCLIDENKEELESINGRVGLCLSNLEKAIKISENSVNALQQTEQKKFPSVSTLLDAAK